MNGSLLHSSLHEPLLLVPARSQPRATTDEVEPAQAIVPTGHGVQATQAGAGHGVQATQAGAGHGVQATQAGAGFDLPDMGPCRHQPVLLILLFDNSPSVAGGNDKPGNRFAEAAVALDHWRRRCQCQRELVAVRTLDRNTCGNVGPVHLDVHGWNEVTSALSLPPEVDQPSSRLRPALLDAERLAHAHPFHRTELVVFSDFELLDGFPSVVIDRLAKFPGRVHALVLTSDPPPRLLAAKVTVGRITADTPAGAVARTIVGAIR